jgi:hypothetical protein
MIPHFRDEMYRDVKTPGENVRERIVGGLSVRGINIRGHMSLYKKKHQLKFYSGTYASGYGLLTVYACNCKMQPEGCC